MPDSIGVRLAEQRSDRRRTSTAQQNVVGARLHETRRDRFVTSLGACVVTDFLYFAWPRRIAPGVLQGSCCGCIGKRRVEGVRTCGERFHSVVVGDPRGSLDPGCNACVQCGLSRAVHRLMLSLLLRQVSALVVRQGSDGSSV
jgi:hypothetical protein